MLFVSLILPLDPQSDRFAAEARAVLGMAVPADLVDDRFGPNWEGDVRAGVFVGAAASDASTGTIVAWVGGLADGTTVRLDALLTVEDREPGDASLLVALLESIESRVGPHAEDVDLASVEHIELWAKPSSNLHHEAANRCGFVEHRSLHQMRCPLPVPAPVLDTRPFRPGTDDRALLDVNNRAFASHPDQGNMTAEDLRRLSAEPWFDPDGIRLFDLDGRVVGFCWTKIHDEPRLGEIYAIGIDPSEHGKGYGAPMTAAGLRWLADQGLDVGMLYVEADNLPALRTYENLGFQVVRTDRAWIKPVADAI